MARWQGNASRPVKVCAIGFHNGFVRFQSYTMDRSEIFQHERSALIRIPAEIMAPIESMKQAITLTKRHQNKIFERIQRLGVILQISEKAGQEYGDSLNPIYQ